MCPLVLIPPPLPDILYELTLDWWNTSMCWEGDSSGSHSREQDPATGLVHPLYYWGGGNGVKKHLKFKPSLKNWEKKSIPERLK